MTRPRIVQLLKLLGATVPSAQNRTGWVVSTCPLAPWRHESGKDSNPSFGVRNESGDAHVNCFSCGFGGSMSDLVFYLRKVAKDDAFASFDWSEIFAQLDQLENEFDLNLDTPSIEEVLFGDAGNSFTHFPDWWLETFFPANQVAFANDYLKERNVPTQVIKDLDIRADTTQQRVCFPVRDFSGRLGGFHGRATSPKTQPRYRMYTYAGSSNPELWLGEHWVDFEMPLVVVEGPFDVASVRRVYPNVVSPLFVSAPKAKLLRMADALEWVTFLDLGTAGDHGRARITKTLSSDHIVDHIYPPSKDLDPGACSVDQLVEIMKKNDLLTSHIS